MRLVVESVIAAGTPVPVRPMVCGLLAALSVIVTAPASAPPVLGVNVTLIVQLAVGTMVAGESGQLFVCAKSLLTAKADIVSGSVPELVSVTV